MHRHDVPPPATLPARDHAAPLRFLLVALITIAACGQTQKLPATPPQPAANDSATPSRDSTTKDADRAYEKMAREVEKADAQQQADRMLEEMVDQERLEATRQKRMDELMEQAKREAAASNDAGATDPAAGTPSASNPIRMPADQLAALLPKVVDHLTLDHVDTDTASELGTRATRAVAHYRGADGSSINVRLIDAGPQSTGLARKRGEWQQLPAEALDLLKYEKHGKLREHPMVERFNEAESRSAIELIIGGRYWIDISGHLVYVKTLRHLIDSIAIESLDERGDD